MTQWQTVKNKVWKRGNESRPTYEISTSFVRSSASVCHTCGLKVLKLQFNIQKDQVEKLQTNPPCPVSENPNCSFLSVGGLAAGIEWLIIKFDLCVYFDYCSLLTSEAPWPWGIQYVNCLALVGNSSSSSSSRVCVCALCICVCYDGQGQLLPAPLPWYFPTEKCLISERAHGVLENESSNGCWQRPWKSMITNVVMPVSDSDHTDAESDLISICNVLAWRGYRTQGVYKISFISAASLKNDHCYFIG